MVIFRYKQLIDMAEHVSDEYYGSLLDDSLNKANNIISTNWEKTLGKTEPYKNIFLGDIEELEIYRRGVFFSGPALKLNVSKSNDKSHSFNMLTTKARSSLSCITQRIILN